VSVVFYVPQCIVFELNKKQAVSPGRWDRGVPLVFNCFLLLAYLGILRISLKARLALPASFPNWHPKGVLWALDVGVPFENTTVYGVGFNHCLCFIFNFFLYSRVFFLLLLCNDWYVYCICLFPLFCNLSLIKTRR